MKFYPTDPRSIQYNTSIISTIIFNWTHLLTWIFLLTSRAIFPVVAGSSAVALVAIHTKSHTHTGVLAWVVATGIHCRQGLWEQTVIAAFKYQRQSAISEEVFPFSIKCLLICPRASLFRERWQPVVLLPPTTTSYLEHIFFSPSSSFLCLFCACSSSVR